MCCRANLDSFIGVVVGCGIQFIKEGSPIEGAIPTIDAPKAAALAVVMAEVGVGEQPQALGGGQRGSSDCQRLCPTRPYSAHGVQAYASF